MVPGVCFEDRSIHVRDAPGTLAGLKARGWRRPPSRGRARDFDWLPVATRIAPAARSQQAQEEPGPKQWSDRQDGRRETARIARTAETAAAERQPRNGSRGTAAAERQSRNGSRGTAAAERQPRNGSRGTAAAERQPGDGSRETAAGRRQEPNGDERRRRPGIGGQHTWLEPRVIRSRS